MTATPLPQAKFLAKFRAKFRAKFLAEFRAKFLAKFRAKFQTSPTPVPVTDGFPMPLGAGPRLSRPRANRGAIPDVSELI